MVPVVWPDVEDYLRAAIETDAYGSRYTMDSVEAALASGEYVLFIAFSEDTKTVLGGVVVTIIDYPGGKWLTCMFAGGTRLKAWQSAASDTIMDFARQRDCIGIQAAGRDGWGKIFGAKKIYSVWERRLDQ